MVKGTGVLDGVCQTKSARGQNAGRGGNFLLASVLSAAPRA